MLIECLIKRDGPTPVELGKTRYIFQQVVDPNRKPGEPSTSVCEVNAEEHLEFLLKGKQFRPYKPGQPIPEEKVINLSGYSIVKHQDGRTEGYRVENSNVKPKKYAGSDGQWKDNSQGMTPFDTEFSAWQWLKDEVEFSEADKDNPDIKSLAGKKK
jgi:hypothetical protein